MSTDLPPVPTDTPRGRRRAAAPVAARAIRKPTGVSPWPITLLAGGPKSENARVAAIASASDLIGRTLWLSWRERTPDALGAIEGARFEIVDHDGTLDDFDAALTHAIGLPRGKDGRPNLVVVDGVSQLWESVKDWGTANAVASSSASFWYAVNDRWSGILATLRKHEGPVLLIGRVDGEQLAGHKDLADDVDVLAEIEDDGSAVLTATRTEPPLHGIEADFEVETIWLLLKLEEISK
jgi:hypothetical protein